MGRDATTKLKGSTNETCFPSKREDVNIVFRDAYITWYGVLLTEMFLYMHIFVLVICCIPIDCFPGECL